MSGFGPAGGRIAYIDVSFRATISATQGGVLVDTPVEHRAGSAGCCDFSPSICVCGVCFTVYGAHGDIWF